MEPINRLESEYFVGLDSSSDFVIGGSSGKTLFKINQKGERALPFNPFFEANLSNQSCSGFQRGSQITLPFKPDNIVSNIGEYYNKADGEFSVNHEYSGVYHFSARVLVNGLTRFQEYVDLILNVGSKAYVTRSEASGDTPFSASISRIVSMKAGEAVSVAVRLIHYLVEPNSDIPINICLSGDHLSNGTTTHYSTFSGYKIA